MSNSITQPIVIKKKVVHQGHHGGAWKVAYADFVTAMMALFIVLWLMNSSKKVQEAVGGYFKDPSGKGKLSGNGIAGNVKTPKDDMEGLKDKIEKAMKLLPDFEKVKSQVQLTLTSEGLRVELLETENGMFFQSGSPKPTEQGEHLLLLMAKEVGKLPNALLIEGHTDSRPYASEGPYSNWELSADRANTARRFMQANGIRAAQVVQVRGYADQKLLKPGEPEDASNRRVSVLVEYEKAVEKKFEPGKQPPAAEKKPAAGH
jgi:chemotaxis protein MotB